MNLLQLSFGILVVIIALILGILTFNGVHGHGRTKGENIVYGIVCVFVMGFGILTILWSA